MSYYGTPEYFSRRARRAASVRKAHKDAGLSGTASSLLTFDIPAGVTPPAFTSRGPKLNSRITSEEKPNWDYFTSRFLNKHWDDVEFKHVIQKLRESGLKTSVREKGETYVEDTPQRKLARLSDYMIRTKLGYGRKLENEDQNKEVSTSPVKLQSVVKPETSDKFLSKRFKVLIKEKGKALVDGGPQISRRDQSKNKVLEMILPSKKKKKPHHSRTISNSAVRNDFSSFTPLSILHSFTTPRATSMTRSATTRSGSTTERSSLRTTGRRSALSTLERKSTTMSSCTSEANASVINRARESSESRRDSDRESITFEEASVPTLRSLGYSSSSRTLDPSRQVDLVSALKLTKAAAPVLRVNSANRTHRRAASAKLKIQRSESDFWNC